MKEEHKDSRLSRHVECRLCPPVILRQNFLLQPDHQGFGLKDEVCLLVQPIPIIRINHLKIKVPDHLGENQSCLCKEDSVIEI